MRRRLRLGASWTLAALLVLPEGALASLWLRGMRYLRQYGAAENPYAAENTEIAGLLALFLLPLVLAALAWAIYETVLWKKRDKGPSEK